MIEELSSAPAQTRRPVAAEHRLFFAIRPDPPTAAKVHGLADRLRQRQAAAGRAMDAERLHITLRLVDRTANPPSQAVIAQAVRTARTVAMTAFKVALNRVETWTEPSGLVVLVGDEGLFGVYALREALASALGPGVKPGFHPHMSLIWRSGAVLEADVEPISWTVREFLLIHSLYGEGRHRLIARFPLGG